METLLSIEQPTSPDNFFGRRKEIRKLARLISTGHSCAIVGDHKVGKTSVLNFLSSPQNKDLICREGKMVLLKYVDAQAFENDLTPTKFWEQVLDFFVSDILQGQINSDLLRTFQNAKRNNFGSYVLEQLFTQMDTYGFNLILFADEWDSMLNRPLLNQVEFYGCLRALASRCPALTLVIACCQSIALLNEKTREFSRQGSPYFNFIQEVMLGPYTKDESDEFLLSISGNFHLKDREFLYQLTGGYPYLLQLGAIDLLDLLLDGKRREERLIETSKNLLDQTSHVISSNFDNWSNEVQKVLCILVLNEVPQLFEKHHIEIQTLTNKLIDYPAELRYLERRGYIIRDNAREISWRVRSQVVIYWVSEKLIISLREKNELGKWLSEKKWDTILSPQDKDLLNKVINGLGKLLVGGIETLISAVIQKWV